MLSGTAVCWKKNFSNASERTTVFLYISGTQELTTEFRFFFSDFQFADFLNWNIHARYAHLKGQVYSRQTIMIVKLSLCVIQVFVNCRHRRDVRSTG